MISDLGSQPVNSGQSRRQVIIGAAAVTAAAVSGLGFDVASRAAVLSTAQPAAAGKFLPFVNKDFWFFDGKGEVALELVRVDQLPAGTRPANLPQPFSLIFWDRRKTALASQTYTVRLPDHSTMAMFVTPVSANPDEYEAPFN